MVTLFILVSVAIILLVFISVLVIQLFQKRRKNSPDQEQHRENLRKHRRKKLKEWNRSILLIESMRRLVEAHPVIENLDEAYNLINQYFKCVDENEYERCRDYLFELYHKGYYRYDDERL